MKKNTFKVKIGDKGRFIVDESHIGCVGRRIKIIPEKTDIIGQDELIQRGKVIGVGPEARCKVGDTIIFSTDGFDKVVLGDETFYYVLDTDQFIYEIL